MSDYVCIITMPELGWDSIVGAYKTQLGALRHVFEDSCEGQTEEELQARYDNSENDQYVIHSTYLGE